MTSSVTVSHYKRIVPSPEISFDEQRNKVRRLGRKLRHFVPQPRVRLSTLFPLGFLFDIFMFGSKKKKKANFDPVSLLGDNEEVT